MEIDDAGWLSRDHVVSLGGVKYGPQTDSLGCFLRQAAPSGVRGVVLGDNAEVGPLTKGETQRDDAAGERTGIRCGVLVEEVDGMGGLPLVALESLTPRPGVRPRGVKGTLKAKSGADKGVECEGGVPTDDVAGVEGEGSLGGAARDELGAPGKDGDKDTSEKKNGKP